ncbi:uncharacterized protein LOC126821920 [Patella vulgata]|uniref:uncharacterized protein LOC126821920 n=1 Tax=Patella vulgata TaxID=6465 RepID=UPI00218091EC|nr:uncharacterized protein LOC126821920 [Patella vulgata]
MADEASVLKDEIEKIKDVLGDDDYGEDENYDSDESDSQLYIDLGLSHTNSNKDKESTNVDASSASGLTYYEGSLGLDEDSRSRLGSIDEDGEDNVMAELPINVETCLALNRAYQEIISEHIQSIQVAINENREKQRMLEAELEGGVKTEFKPSTSKEHRYLNLPYFRNSTGLPPPPNEDVKLKGLLNEKKQEAKIMLGWPAKAQRQLISAVSKDSLQKLLQPLMNRREILENKKLKAFGVEKEALEKKIEELDQEISLKKTTTEEYLLKNVDEEKVDWMRIAKIEFDGKREWYELQKIWRVVVNPEINKQDWTEEETENLLQLVEKYKTGHWDQIVEELGTNRTPFQAMQFYQANLNFGLRQKPWTEDEDEKLGECVKFVCNIPSERIKWKKVSYMMEARSAEQCRKRWYQIDPDISRLKWKAEEDVRLMLAVKLIGSKDWIKVSRYIPHRHPAQCRERYCNYLDPSLKVGCGFTYQEDKQLLTLVKQIGIGNWAKVAACLEGRTDQMVSTRYKRLMQWRYSANWFKKQPTDVQRAMQGLPLYKKKKNEKPSVNWDTYYKDYGLRPEHYQQQAEDIQENGESEFVVPLPPLIKVPLKGTHKKVLDRHRESLAVSRHIDSLLEDHVIQLPPNEMENRKKEILRRLEERNESLYSSSVQKLIKEAKEAAKELHRKRVTTNKERHRTILDLRRTILGSSIKPRLTTGRPTKYFALEEISEVEQRKLSVSILSLFSSALELDGEAILENIDKRPNKENMSVSQKTEAAIFREVVLKDKSYTGVPVQAQSIETNAPTKNKRRLIVKHVNPPPKRARKRRKPDEQNSNEQSATGVQNDPEVSTSPGQPSTSEIISSVPLRDVTPGTRIENPTTAQHIQNDDCSSNSQQKNAEQSTSSNQTTSAHQQPTSSKQPTLSLPPTLSQQPALSQQACAQQPVSSQTPTSSQQPVSSQTPVSSQQPVSSQPPTSSQQPASSQTPVSSQQPTSSQQPASSQQPVLSQHLNPTQSPSSESPSQTILKSKRPVEVKNGPVDEMPFLPPNHSSLKAFKKLLVSRKDMMKQAGGAYIHLRKLIDRAKRNKLFTLSEMGGSTQNASCQYVYVFPKNVQKSSNSDTATSSNQDDGKDANNYLVSTVSRADVHENNSESSLGMNILDNDEPTSTTELSVVLPRKYPETIVKTESGTIDKVARVPALVNNLVSKKLAEQLFNKQSSSNQSGNIVKRNTSEAAMASTSVSDGDCENNQSETSSVTSQNIRGGSGVANEMNSDNRYTSQSQQTQTEETEEESVLDKIRQSHDYKMLKARFQSIFIWPALLSSLYIQNEEEEKEKADKTVPSPKEKRKRRKNRFPCSRSSKYYKYVAKNKKEKESILALARESKKRKLQGDVPTETDGGAETITSGGDNCILSTSKGDNSVLDTSVADSSVNDSVTLDQEGDHQPRKKGRPRGSKTKIGDMSNRRQSSRHTEKKSYTEETVISTRHCEKKDYHTPGPKKTSSETRYRKAVYKIVTNATQELVKGLRSAFTPGKEACDYSGMAADVEQTGDVTETDNVIDVDDIVNNVVNAMDKAVDVDAIDNVVEVDNVTDVDAVDNVIDVDDGQDDAMDVDKIIDVDDIVDLDAEESS